MILDSGRVISQINIRLGSKQTWFNNDRLSSISYKVLSTDKFHLGKILKFENK